MDVAPTPQQARSEEPALAVGSITVLASGVVAAAAIFGTDLDTKQITAVLAALAIIAPTVSTLIIRSRVWSPATVARLLKTKKLHDER